MAVRQRENGQWIETSYFDNIGGLNNSDSPFKVKDTQATGGVNFGYTIDGAIQKRQGHDVVNTTADVELISRGLEIYNTTLGVKTLIRSADRKIQAVNLDAETFTNLSQDVTSTTTNVFPASTSINTVFANFNTDTISMLHFAGGTDSVYTVYNTNRYTKNGAVTPSGTLGVASTLSTGGSWLVTGDYRYAVSWHKASTGAESNASSDFSVNVATTLQTTILSLSGLTSIDTTTYDYGILWRSALNGSDGFTAGSIVTTFVSNATTVQDTGASILDSQNVPRADSLVLDNSELPSGTYNVVALWKRRLVTATGSVLRFSELNLPESWPTVNTITIPSGGPITGLAVISFNTDFGNDEYLAVFKERELWLVKGNDYSDVTLSFIDTVGCPNQSLIALANGFLTWIDYRGIYLWDGSGKPIYCSKPIEALFAIDGDLNKSLLTRGVAQYSRTQSQVLWFVSSKIYGDQKLVIKLDLRLTLPGVESNLSGRILDGVFTLDYQDEAFYAAKAYIPSSQSEEIIITGDDAGFLYDAYSVYADSGNGIDFQYYTPFMDLGSPNIGKRFQKIIVWVDEIGDWDLTLDYWAGYRAALQQKSTLQDQIGTIVSNQTALWDVAFWDEAFWDDYTPRLRGLVFHLNNTGGNSEGDCLRLRFRNDGANEPITIHGYTVIWQEKAATK